MSGFKGRIRRSIQSRTLIGDTLSYCLIPLGFGDKYLIGLNSMYKAYSWVAKKLGPFYKDYLNSARSLSGQTSSSGGASKTVWVCWFQGIENAPTVVRQCYASLEEWLSDWDIVTITSENYDQYVSIPDYIVDKWKRGIISYTHFSDILRVALLVEHGGLWVDATTFMTGPLPDYVLDNELFVYRNGWMDSDMINMESWFIYSRFGGNRFLKQVRDLLFEYWKRYSFLKNYFLFHMIFRIVEDENRLDWERIPYFHQIDNHLLMRELQQPFNRARIEQIKRITTVHKLTYKLPECGSSCTVHHLMEINEHFK